MAEVSILIPAYRPDYLMRALVSACTQTFSDIEILVGDDTPDASLEEIVNKAPSPHVRYFHHGFREGARNCKALWERATGKYVKWLYDDDLLMPSSVQVLVEAMRSEPAARLAFHDRVLIDGQDKVIQVPPPLLSGVTSALVDRAALTRLMVGQLNNFVGEPSNVMVLREALDMATSMSYGGWDFSFLADVATFLNVANTGPLLAVKGYHSCFRRHEKQNSAGQSPYLSAGFYEWEVLVRGEAAAGRFSAEQLVEVRQKLANTYNFALVNHGLLELKPLLENLAELTSLPVMGLADSPRFLNDLQQARRACQARIQARNAADDSVS